MSGAEIIGLHGAIADSSDWGLHSMPKNANACISVAWKCPELTRHIIRKREGHPQSALDRDTKSEKHLIREVLETRY